MTTDYVLYILMRSDLASLNPGKAVAQGTHAANMFQSHIDRLRPDPAKQTDSSESAEVAHFDLWRKQATDFGTAITLTGNIAQIQRALECVGPKGIVSGLVVDPTYPLRDGEVTHLIELPTCAYIFAPRKIVNYIIGDLGLMP